MTQTDKDVICRCYFYSINWFIEVINTFASQKTMRAKVIQRLRDVVDLKNKFFHCLAKNPTFMPPPCVFYGEPVHHRIAKSAATKAKGNKITMETEGKGKKTNKKADIEDATLAVASQNKVVVPNIFFSKRQISSFIAYFLDRFP